MIVMSRGFDWCWAATSDATTPHAPAPLSHPMTLVPLLIASLQRVRGVRIRCLGRMASLAQVDDDQQD